MCFFLVPLKLEKTDKTQFATNIRFDTTRFDSIETCAIDNSSRSPLRKEREFFNIFQIAVNLLPRWGKKRSLFTLGFLSGRGSAKPLRFFSDRSRSTRKSYRWTDIAFCFSIILTRSCKSCERMCASVCVERNSEREKEHFIIPWGKVPWDHLVMHIHINGCAT